MRLIAGLYPLLRPVLFALDPETAHDLTVRALSLLPRSRPGACDPRLAIDVLGQHFPNPIGLAAGFDKNAQTPDAMLALGFGFVECGTVTPLPQPGNPKPRMFRLVEDAGVINRLGFNNAGLAAAQARLKARPRAGIVGGNVGANKDSADRKADYAAGVAALAPHVDYLTINISSPNTPGLRALQSRDALTELVTQCQAARGEAQTPLLVKVAPDLTPADVEDIAEVALDRGVDGLIVSNTTITRPMTLRAAARAEVGGLSGAPLKPLALDMLRQFARATGGRLPLIGVGGIASGADVYERMRAGASLVQLYSALVYEGPGLAARMQRDLLALMDRDGVARLQDIVGADL
ncbi:quinone-dependent dihydroorotate dehydrogenase [Hankyongella ginsenosidimutans]|uniref:Dihydroorotate dehydrogenase (quinone) n=1 Tax=Hankyongella ginsenosidimutans TaxID=1763828 RepID=A0A4D7C554_9SPHN|nr:quinone-dependent dihydroorotate dehydrogenase [Hankyongella ginsenosidimutans]QCI78700.1 quinone-dependent dihydroorotate dehydrogenase [Hankyongella ginsenosidimutans]